MHPRNIALVAFSAVVLGALVLLLIEVNTSAEVEVSEEALAQARARYDRSQTARSQRRSPPPSAPSPPSRPPPSRPPPSPSPSPSDESLAKARMRAMRARMDAERPRPTVPTASLEEIRGLEAGKDDAPRGRAASDGTPNLAMQRRELRSAYDRGNYDLALQHAKEYLREKPDDRYVMRVTVTSACATGDEDTARSIYERMIEEDRRIERLRCAKYGIDL